MANDSNNSQKLTNENLNGNANRSLPSFDPRQNQYKQNQQNIADRVKATQKQNIIKEGVKKGATAFGVPEGATEAILNTETGKEALEAAGNASTLSEGTREVVKVIAKNQLKKYIPLIIVPIFLIFAIFLMIFNKDVISGMGDPTDYYEELRQKIADIQSEYSYKADIDGTLILATLLAYNDNSELESTSVNAKNFNYLKNQVETLAKYQIMTLRACDEDSSTLRKIASNDHWLTGEANYNCIVGMEGEQYALSIDEGIYTDDNSGSVYYWNLIDENFIFDFYNEYMVDQKNNTQENVDRINEIIDTIYLYYHSLKDTNNGEDYFQVYMNSSEFWWPIGSSETTNINGKLFASGEPIPTYITATFGGADSVHEANRHGAIDISGDVYNKAYVIATMSGTVIYPVDRSQTQYGDGCHKSQLFCTAYSDGGGLGNYVIIDHGNGIYSYYGHMYKDSITVFAGDTVEQGQVIGKVGTSGNSTGAHLHFEIRSGGMAQTFRVDPLLYVSQTNPRPIGNQLTTWIKTVEGGTTGSYVSGDNYVVYPSVDGSLVVGYGVEIVDKNGNQLYTDIYHITVEEGSLIPIELVDKMFDKKLATTKSFLNLYITDNSVSLNSNQYDAMLSFMLDCGNEYGSNAMQAYGSSKNTEALWDVMSQCTTKVIQGESKELYRMKLRRAEEYELFLNGDYNYDPLSYIIDSKVKYYDVLEW